MDMKVLKGEVVPVFEEYSCVRLTFVLETGEQRSAQGLHTCFVLDRSGSMAGSRIADAKGALVSFINKVEKLGLPITVIAFDDKIETRDSKQNSYMQLEEWVRTLTERGGTMFNNVFEFLEKMFVEQNLVNTYVVFLSDGEDSLDRKGLAPYLEKFQRTITEHNFSCAIHTIGFGESHDAELLTSLTCYGTKEGTFQFVESNGRVPVAVNNASEFLYESSFWGQYIGPDNKPHKMEITSQEDEKKTQVGMAFVKRAEAGPACFELFVGNNKHRWETKLEPGTASSLEERVHLFTSFVSKTVLDVLRQRQTKQLNPETVKELREWVPRVSQSLDRLIEEVKKQRSLQRKQLMPFCLQPKELLGEYFTVIQEDVHAEISNLKLAQLNRLAYQDILQRSLLKKIRRRVGANASMLQEIDQEIDKKKAAMDFEKIKEKYKDRIETYGHCVISYKDWLDALQDGDCLCLTLDARRAESGIMDPSQVRIMTINTTRITAESFLDSALFITRAGQIIRGVGEHGASASTLVKGLPDEIITGLLPLYITEEHWQIARLRMKPLLAWTIAQDVLAYEPKQLIVLPCLVLAKAATCLTQAQVHTHEREVFQLVLDTCLAIYRENTELILPDLKAHFSSYVQHPEIRTVDIIPSNKVFLIHLYLASKQGDINTTQISKLLPYVWEEELRRHVQKKSEDPHELMKQVIGFNIEKHVTRYMQTMTKLLEDRFESEEGERIHHYVRKFQSLQQSAKPPRGPEPMQDVPSSPQLKVTEAMLASCADSCGPLLFTLTPRVKDLIAELDELLCAPASPVFETCQLAFLFAAKPPAGVVELGLHTAAQQAFIAIQTTLQHDNQARRAAIAAGEFADPYDEDAATKRLKQLSEACLKRERQSQVSKMLSREEKKESLVVAPLFASTDDLQAAAGVVHGTMRGSKGFQVICTALRRPACPHILAKLQMLISGQYMGVKLINDAVVKKKQKQQKASLKAKAARKAQTKPMDSVQKRGEAGPEETKSEKREENQTRSTQPEAKDMMWKPSKKHIYPIWVANHDSATLEQWQATLPHLAEYLQQQEQRRQGLFVPYRHPKGNVRDPRHLVNKPKKVKKVPPAKPVVRGPVSRGSQQHHRSYYRRGQPPSRGLHQQYQRPQPPSHPHSHSRSHHHHHHHHHHYRKRLALCDSVVLLLFSCIE